MTSLLPPQSNDFCYWACPCQSHGLWQDQAPSSVVNELTSALALEASEKGWELAELLISLTVTIKQMGAIFVLRLCLIRLNWRCWLLTALARVSWQGCHQAQSKHIHVASWYEFFCKYSIRGYGDKRGLCQRRRPIPVGREKTTLPSGESLLPHLRQKHFWRTSCHAYEQLSLQCASSTSYTERENMQPTAFGYFYQTPMVNSKLRQSLPAKRFLPRGPSLFPETFVKFKSGNP